MTNYKTIWTQFMDMHSGGRCKEEPYEFIYIEAPESEARIIFYNRFGHSPSRVSCTCCGEDYSVSEGTLDQISAYFRGCRYEENERRYVEKPNSERWSREYTRLADYLQSPNVLAIPVFQIKREERLGSVPEQGYVWRD